MKKALLIDGHSLAYRAFFAVGGLTTKEGQPTNALFGFVSMVLQIIKNYSPEQIYVAFDLPQPTFRHEMYKEYKANREKPPEEFISQIPIIKEFVQELGLNMVQQPGFEADDVIGSLAKKLSREGISPYIVTGDKDSFQLVTDDIHVLLTKKGISEIEEYGPEQVFERYGLTVEQMIDMKALMGDNSDNIPGVKGIGEKTAIKLLQDYKTIEGVYENISKIQGKLQEKLIQDKDKAFLSKELVTINTVLEVETQAVDTVMDNEKLLEFFKKYELNSLIKRFLGVEKVVRDVQMISFEVVDSEEKLIRVVDLLSSQQEIGLYCEYDDRTNELVAISFSTQDGKCFVVPLAFACGNLSSTEHDSFGPMFAMEKPTTTASLQGLFALKAHKNISDVKRLIRYLDSEGLVLLGTYDDILVMDYLLEPDRSNREVERMLKVYFSEELETKKELLSKNKKFHFCEIPAEKALEYLAIRAAAILRLKTKLTSLLKEEDLLFIYQDMELPLIDILFRMEKEGILLDKKYLKEMSLELHSELKVIEQAVYLLAGEEFNINSNKQLQEILFDKLKLPTSKKIKTGYSTNIDVLEELASKYEIATKLIEYRQLNKLLNTYVDALPKLTDSSDRLHTTFNATVASTGRLSSSDPNLQNIPIRGDSGSKVRGAFIAKPGYVLIVADYSQIELRILAHISKDEKLIEAFLKGQDIHSATAASVFGVPLEAVTKELRGKAKAINFGLAYGMGAFNMANSLGMEVHEAQHHIDVYFSNFPNIKKFMDEAPQFVLENGYIKTLYGRKRYFRDFASLGKREQNSQIRMIINYPMQGLAADIIKLAMIQLDKEISGFEAKVLLQVHDELIVEVKEAEAEQLKNVIVKTMESSYQLDVQLVVNASVAHNWLEAK
ncbi:MAG: DNA polymerase I [Candidatus Margulisbacteria bacterium]|nr:DNA polymerase I [Candidatus Margulisiibacteriota bacterium]